MKDVYEKRGYLLEEFRLFHLRDAAGTEVDFHYHEFCKVLMLISGSGGYTVEGQRYRLEPGDVVVIGNRCVHRPEFAPGTPYERIIIYIDPEFLREHATKDCDLRDMFNGERHVLRPGEADSKELLRIAGSLEQELSGNEYGRELVSRGLLMRLLVQMMRCLRKGESHLPEPVAPKDSRIQEILAYIDAHLTEDLDADTIAEAFYVSKFHMMRRFRAETGESVHGYISRRRLLLARDLIGQGVSVTDACFQSGFKSYSSFARAYGKLFGTTPTGRMETAARESGYE